MKLYPQAMAVGLALLGNVCSAFELNWADENWVGGYSAQQYEELDNVDESGIDVSISIILNGTTAFSSSTSASGNNIYLGVDYPDSKNNYIDISISFSSYVQGVSFTLNDVDRGGTYDYSSYWEDIIENISGTSVGGSSIDGTVTAGSGIEVDTTSDPGNTLYRGTDYDNWSAPSQMTLTWDAPVSEVSFRYSGGDLSRSNPGFQIIGFSGITFHEYNAVPEPGTYLLGGLGSVAITLSFLIRRKKKKSMEMPNK